MAIYKSKYWINHNVYHFETDDRVVNILDDEKNTIGTLREMLFTGKTITSGNFTDIKHSGVYRIKGLSGLPDNIPSDKDCLLTVTAIGNVDNPDLILYRLISPNGVIIENTVSGDKQSGWGSGGVNLQNTIKEINSGLGEVSQLQTKAHNLTEALNEVDTRSKGNETGLQKITQQFNSHNHDTRYLQLTGGHLSGDLSLDNNKSLKLKNIDGTGVNLAYMDRDNHIHIGEDGYELSLSGKGEPQYNGAKLITSDNIERLDLSINKLDGYRSSDFIKSHESDVKTGNLEFAKNSYLNFNVDGIDNAIFVLKAKGYNKIGTLRSNTQGSLEYSLENTKTKWTLDANGRGIDSVNTSGITFDNDTSYSQEPRITWRRVNSDGQYMDAGIWLCQPTYGYWSDFEKNHTVAWYNGRTQQSLVQYGVGTNGESIKIFNSPYIGNWGRRLFMQDPQPSGDIPYGSVWIGF